MAKKDPLSFNFGANAKLRKRKKGKKKTGKRKSGKGNAWRQYVGGGWESIPE